MHKSHHLKRIAAAQNLPNSENLTLEEIDKSLKMEILTLSDISSLNFSLPELVHRGDYTFTDIPWILTLLKKKFSFIKNRDVVACLSM